MLRSLDARPAFTLIELLIAFCVIFVLVGMFAVYANVTLKAARETALRNELLNLRMSIEHYRVVNGLLPEELTDLTRKDLTYKKIGDTIIQGSFLKSTMTSKEGYLLDPFMNRYNYDSSKGRVWSDTKGYENW